MCSTKFFSIFLKGMFALHFLHTVKVSYKNETFLIKINQATAYLVVYPEKKNQQLSFYVLKFSEFHTFNYLFWGTFKTTTTVVVYCFNPRMKQKNHKPNFNTINDILSS